MKPYGLVWDYGQFEPKRNTTDQKLQRANALRSQKKTARREARREIADQLKQDRKLQDDLFVASTAELSVYEDEPFDIDETLPYDDWEICAPQNEGSCYED